MIPTHHFQPSGSDRLDVTCRAVDSASGSHRSQPCYALQLCVQFLHSFFLHAAQRCAEALALMQSFYKVSNPKAKVQLMALKGQVMLSPAGTDYCPGPVCKYFCHVSRPASQRFGRAWLMHENALQMNTQRYIAMPSAWMLTRTCTNGHKMWMK